jgi:signal peptidase I
MGRSSATLPSAATSQRTSPARPAPPRNEGYRDTVEAIVVAFILALVVRGFEAQAFVIPTGSMAPTLMGRHKEIACPQCGFVYAVNASEEVEPRMNARDFDEGDLRGKGYEVSSGLCVNCRYLARSLHEAPSFKGDRILVMMFPYDLPFLPGSRPPGRWDIVVFRYPEDPEVSYIKRLIGLPGETIRVAHGDIYVKAPGGGDFVLARKPLIHQSAMQINVYDDRYRPKALAGLAEWARWRPGPAWTSGDPAESRYRAEGSGDSWSELRYHHLVPDPEQWDAILNGSELPRPPRSTLITDFYSYNTNLQDLPNDRIGNGPYSRSAWMQANWVGDLTLESAIDVKRVNPGSAVRWELVKAGVAHRCTIDLTTGVATFTRGDEVLGQVESGMKGEGRHRVGFGNVDDRMTLVIDGRPVGEPGLVYETGSANPIPTAGDLAPAAVAVRDATIEVSDLVLKRDIYYTQTPGEPDYNEGWDGRKPQTATELFDFLSDPSRFSGFGQLRSRDFEVAEDRFFMMGDNSPRSSDSRAWGARDRAWDDSAERKDWEVPRQYLTGKAFYVYWPHGVPFWPEIFRLGRDFRFPFRPYIERMKWIR